jgi:hypothetical protein
MRPTIILAVHVAMLPFLGIVIALWLLAGWLMEERR